MRLDLYLVDKKLVRSRSNAKQIIENGNVLVNGKVACKSGLDICENDNVVFVGEVNKYVSKGGLKLERGIDAFNLNFSGVVVVDIGASTGGFTDCALKAGAKKVYAIDVGHNQLSEELKNNDVVVSIEGVDFRNLDRETILDCEIAVADVSFISLLCFVEKLKELNFLKYFVFLIKPQFECGLSIAKKYKGVVLDEEVHYDVLVRVLSKFKEAGFVCEKLTYSAVTGGDGNIEYIALFKNENCEKTSVLSGCFAGNCEPQEDVVDLCDCDNFTIGIKCLIEKAFKKFKTKK